MVLDADWSIHNIVTAMTQTKMSGTYLLLDCQKINTTKNKCSKSWFHSLRGRRRSKLAGIMRAVRPWSE